jgi:hypothetical protein
MLPPHKEQILAVDFAMSLEGIDPHRAFPNSPMECAMARLSSQTVQ